jgi:LDH2 family malate/lactate/ureidoglycolate dehydrogenase
MTLLGDPEVTGGHKGYGLGLMVQILSATLTGAAFAPLRSGTRPASEPDDIRHFFLALDPRTPCPDGGFEDDFAAMAGLLPGDPEEAERAVLLRDGIPVPAALAKHLPEIRDRCGTHYLLQED